MSEPLRDVVTFPRDAVVDTAHVAAALGVSEEIVAKMDLPSFNAGKRPRFLWGQVLDELAHRAKPEALPLTIPRRSKGA